MKDGKGQGMGGQIDRTPPQKKLPAKAIVGVKIFKCLS